MALQRQQDGSSVGNKTQLRIGGRGCQVRKLKNYRQTGNKKWSRSSVRKEDMREINTNARIQSFWKLLRSDSYLRGGGAGVSMTAAHLLRTSPCYVTCESG